jgi:hypothetical protein
LLPDNNQGYSACDQAVGIVRGRDEVAGMEAFVGFYWTLPVNWSGFRSLPSDVEAAAAKSRTIRYQRAMVQNWVRNNPPAELVDEIAFMDTRPDRATEAVREALSKAQKAFGNRRKAKLLYVKFELMQWRRNIHLLNYIEEQGIYAVPLSPDPLTIDGQYFDPREHFRTWREAEEAAMAGFKEGATAGLRHALSEIPEGPARHKNIADFLNERGIKAYRGGGWTAENVRKQLMRGKADRHEKDTA